MRFFVCSSTSQSKTLITFNPTQTPIKAEQLKFGGFVINLLFIYRARQFTTLFASWPHRDVSNAHSSCQCLIIKCSRVVAVKLPSFIKYSVRYFAEEMTREQSQQKCQKSVIIYSSFAQSTTHSAGIFNLEQLSHNCKADRKSDLLCIFTKA